MLCEILVTTKNGQEVAGQVRLVNGKITSHANQGYSEMMYNIIKTPNMTKQGDQVSAKEFPQEWFTSLPRNYTNQYVRARMIK